MSGALAVLVAGPNTPFFPSVTNRSLSTTTTSPADPQVGIEFNTNGELVTYANGGGIVRSPEWAGTQGLTYANAVRGRFQIRLTVQSGAAPNGFSDDIDTWLPLTEQRSWFLSLSAVGTSTGTWLLEIRCDGSMPALASATYTVSVTEN